MEQSDFFAHVVARIGPLSITDTVVTTWGLILGTFLLAVWLARGLVFAPGRKQIIAEGIVLAIQSAVQQVLPHHYKQVTPFIMTLWIFLVIANLIGLIPGLHSPTRDLSATAALAALVFLSVHWFGIRAQGLRAYLKHYLSPTPLLLPFHVISEITRTIALAVRLFGNMMSLEMVALLLLIVGGLFVPIPVLMLHIVEALVQAYVFGMLALVYIASTIQSQQLKQEDQTSKE